VPTLPGVPTPPPPTPPATDIGELPCREADEVRARPLMGISWLRSVLLELCIFTASDKEVVSPGSGVRMDRRVIVSEQSLEKMQLGKHPGLVLNRYRKRVKGGSCDIEKFAVRIKD